MPVATHLMIMEEKVERDHARSSQCYIWIGNIKGWTGICLYECKWDTGLRGIGEPLQATFHAKGHLMMILIVPQCLVSELCPVVCCSVYKAG